MNKIKENHGFSFELIDDQIPDEVAAEALSKVEKETNGLVIAHVDVYVKHSDDVSDQSKSERVNIQRPLGRANDEKKTYEIYLTVKGVPDFKYRIMFLEYGSIAYPAGMVLSDELSTIVTSVYEYRYSIESIKELRHVMERIMSANYFHTLLQSFINEALRREEKKS
jgi:hypothetical protein